MATINLENSYTVPFGAYSITYFTLPDGRVCWELYKNDRIIRSDSAETEYEAIQHAHLAMCAARKRGTE